MRFLQRQIFQVHEVGYLLEEEEELCLLTVSQREGLSNEYRQRHPKTLHSVTSSTIKDL